MMFMVFVPRRSLLTLVLLAVLPPVQAAQDTGGGAVVERVAARSTASVAGLLPGDLILSWSSAASQGDVVSPLDLLPVEIEEAPRHPITLRGRRGDEERTWVLATGEWGMETRPAQEAAAGDGRLAAWFLDRKARELSEARKWPEADAAYAEAVEVLKREAGPVAAAETLRAWGSSFQFRNQWDAAIDRFRQALALDRETSPKSLSAARTLLALGQAMAKKGDFEAAEAFLQQGLAIDRELAPGSLELAGAFNKLGVLARWRGNLGAAEEYLSQTEELRRRLAPGSIAHGLALTNLGNVVFDGGDLARSESLHRQALAIFEGIEPDGGALVGCLQNLANVLLLRGDLAGVDELLRRKLDIQERRGANDWESWSTLTSLGQLAMDRGDLEAAEVYYRRALAVQEKKPSPEGGEIALSLGNLGELALQKGDFTAARAYLRRAQDIEEKLEPGSLTSAEGLEALARLELVSSGDLAAAEDLLRRALAIFEQKAPGSVEISAVLRDLGEVVGRRGRLQEGLDLRRRALELQSRLAPGSTEEAATLYSLGRAERRAGRNEEGIRDLCRAVDVLDRQRIRLGGTLEEKTSFEATLGQYYQTCLEGRIALGQPAEAFHVLERGRARSFLALLAERDLRLSDLPPELAAERRRVNAEYDRVQSELAPLKAGQDDEEIERLTGELSDLRIRQDEISARLRREAPRSAALQDPEPLDLEGVRAALDRGTVLLEYAVGEERSWLFVVEPSGLSVFPVAADAKALRKEVEGFRLLLRDPDSDQAKIRTTARRLYDLLVRPAESRVSGAKRLLVSPDGPLHTLAFAALRRGDRYLVEWKPVHHVLSATVYAELVSSRRPAGSPAGESLAAFGDPVYKPETPATPAGTHNAGRPGSALVRLPFSGREVKAIAGLFPRARVYLGADATEERVKSLGPETRLVHFACHGLLDERFPLNSALALSVPGKKAEGRDNGLLQAWEIFESVRLDADLVTLSACDTALGREMGGEGLIGLTRAFQYAGARSVLASLWSIADSSTARFMQSFYGNLRKGMSKDEALRAAQIERIKGTHPFHWAAFQLTGDWR